VKPLLDKLNNVGFERTRRAVAGLALSVFIFLYLFVAVMMSLNGNPQWVPAFVGMALAYVVAFMSVVAEFFWGRWFAVGLGWSGVMIATAGLFQIGEWNPVLGIFGALHGLVVLMLSGAKMAEHYEQQPAWRERYGMDEFGVARLRKTVTRASASLPSVILWALAPKEPGQGMFAVATFAAGALALAGLAGLVRIRTWGLLALAGAATALVFAGGASFPHFDVVVASSAATFNGWVDLLGYRALVAGPALPVLLIGAALAPFAVPAVRYLRSR
jgi:hypothetical protein